MAERLDWLGRDAVDARMLVLWNPDTDGCKLALLLHTLHLASGS
jgi:hypothetical protein